MSSDASTPEPQPEPLPPLPPVTPAPRFDAVPYQADGGAPPLGLALLLGGTLMAATLIGFMVGWIHQWFYLVLLFPLFMGLGMGAVGSLLIKLGRVRSAPLAGVAAVLAGIMMMGSMHYVEYLRFLDNLNQQVPGFRARAMAQGDVFLKYMDLKATIGVQIGKFGQKGINLGHVGSYIYWIVETIVVAAIAFAMMWSRASSPYCRECDVWKEEKPLAMVATPTTDMAVEAVREGQLASLLECATPVSDLGLLLRVASCPQCGDAGFVDVGLEQVSKNPKGEKQVKSLTRVTYPGEVLRFLDGGRKAE